MSDVLVTSAHNVSSPFNGVWETNLVGYTSADAPTGAGGSSAPTTALGIEILAVGFSTQGPQGTFGSFDLLMMPEGTPQDFFDTVTVTIAGGSPNVYEAAEATFYLATVNGAPWVTGPQYPTWLWPVGDTVDFSAGVVTTLSFGAPVTTSISGQGDITNPGAWEDSQGNIPPLSYQNVPQTVNYPLNGDGRYWFIADAENPTPDPITFIGDATFQVAGTLSLQASITQAANDGSELFIAYALDGATFVAQQLGPSLQSAPDIPSGPVSQSQLSNQLLAALAGTTELVVKVYSTGGTASPTATPWNVAVAITRNANERIAWDYPNPFNPISYNCECTDNVVPTETLAALRTDILTELGFAAQAANPPPGMAALVNSWLSRGQKFLYRRYSQLHTRRMFRWKVNPGQRFYSLKDNDEDVLCNFQMDPMKQIEWAGIQDSRNVWYPLIEGIQPQLYTMIDKPWRPARYEIRQCIELYPAPDQTYWMWMKAHFGLMAFASDGDSTTIDSTLVFLHVLSIAKAHYGQPDANNVQAMANAYRKELIAGTHGTKKYIPGTVAIPPAVRPTLIQFQGNQGG